MRAADDHVGEAIHPKDNLNLQVLCYDQVLIEP